MKHKLKLKKQYGIVHKQILTNKNISANAKALYVYFCARSGNKGVCFPTIPTICKDLGICETTFQKLKNELISAGIIEVSKTSKGILQRNNYKLLHTTNKGFGYVYLDILTDNRLSLKSKAIYGLLASYSGSSFVAYPYAKMIYSLLNIGRNTYFKAVKLLKDFNYLITKQTHFNGKFAHCNFFINGQQPTNLNTKPCFNTFNKPSNVIINTTKNYPADSNIEYSDYELLVKDNIEYNSLVKLYQSNTKANFWLNNILSVLTNTIYFEDASLNTKNITVPCNRLKSIFNKLKFNHIKQVIENLLNQNNKINNVREYIKVSLYNMYFQVEQMQYNTLNTNF